MLRTILLISPIYVCLLWFITLLGNSRKYSNPRIYLGWFMLLPLLIFSSHFLYFAPLPAIYPYFDIILQGASLLVFPAYYIYFRLLTIDDDFSIKVHYKFILFPVIITIIYALGVLLTPKIEFRTWLFNDQAYPDSIHIWFLKILRHIIRLTILIQVVLVAIGNALLITKYSSKAEQYYSDDNDGKYNNAKMLNYSLLILSAAAFILTILGRYLLSSKDLIINLGWSVFTIMLFAIGYMGARQKPINPTFELVPEELDYEPVDLKNTLQKEIINKLKVEFEQKKIYLNSQLNIFDVVQVVGTNRTYISNIINQHYNVNFCSFVNNYRLIELEQVIIKNPLISNEQLAEKCGFGSINSMKRAIASRTGHSITTWKKDVIKSN